MGGSESKTVINSLTESINNIAETSVQDCSVISDQTQTISTGISGFSWGAETTVTQTTDVSSTCFQDTAREMQLQNDIVSAIMQANESSSVALLGAFGKSSAEARSNLTTLVKNNVTMTNIQRNYNLIKQGQRVDVHDSGIMINRRVDISQGAKVFAQSTLQSVASAGILNKIKKEIDQSASATQTNPLSFISDIFTGTASMIMYGLLFFVVIIIAMIFMLKS